MTTIGQLNIYWGWIWMVLGIASGSLIGMWAFAGPMKAPPNHREYDSLQRRMVRLAHIAMFMLPLINISYGHHIDLIPLEDSWKTIGSYGMIICMIGVPTFLIGASFYLPIKYLEVFPVGAGFLALAIISYGNFLLLIQ
jgi:hypothetical protein